MEDLLFPSSVAVVGATPNLANLAKNIIQNLLDAGFKGRIYPVAPSGGEVYGLPIHKSVMDIPGEVEFAAILIPAASIPAVLEECGRKGIRRALVSSGGFDEFSDSGSDLAQELLRIARKYDIRFLGPNCIGIINLENGLCLPFSPVEAVDLRKGPHSIIAQSGGVTLRLAHLFSEEGLGFSKLFSVGNKLNINEVDLVTYLIDDSQTEQIFLYLEGIDDLKGLMKMPRRTKKPIVVCKATRYEETQEIARCHTAALASDDRIIDAGLKQAGILRVDTLQDMALCARALKLPPLRGDNLAVLSVSGGVAVLIADACIACGFTLPPLPRDLIDHIEKHRRGGVIRMTNPLDFGDVYNVEMFRYAVDAVLSLDTIDGLVLSMPFSPHMAKLLGQAPDTDEGFGNTMDLSREFDKPIALSFFTQRKHVDGLRERLALPVFDDAVQSVRAMRFLRDFTRSREKTITLPKPYVVEKNSVKQVFETARNEQRRELFCHEALRILDRYGIPVIESRFAENLDEARRAAEALRYPVAMKIVSPQISHKSDLGGVVLNLRNEVELARAYEEMFRSVGNGLPDAELRGITLQKMESEGSEMILGAKLYPTAGHAILLGMGGSLVEILDDVSFRIPPISREEAGEMIGELRGHRALKGFRGAKAADLEALTDAILRLAQLLEDFPELEEIDINPIMVLAEGRGVRALDSRIVF
jgi:acetyltransferase